MQNNEGSLPLSITDTEENKVEDDFCQIEANKEENAHFPTEKSEESRELEEFNELFFQLEREKEINEILRNSEI